MNWKLIAISEPIEGQTIVIDRDMVIGRHQQADIVLQASHVSRRHAALLLKEQGRQLWIQDLESSNGTFVNDQRITSHQLKHLDQINFETIRFKIVAEQADASTTSTPTVVPDTSVSEPTVAESVLSEAEITESIETKTDKIETDKTETAPVSTAPDLEKVVPSDQGMPTLAERGDVEVKQDGMPENVGVPKPAPIPEHVAVDVAPEPKAVPIEQPESRVEQAQTQQKNAKVGLMSLIVLVILIVLAVIFFVV
ncbi:FHA domain-containing protein [Acinetobacter marinus]|uniref:FHA domain-containing protein n=1 Tax=Acinetobacter marinus TaxID=281375 RepID=A0A1G6HAX7_9GAMM|nr:FHA domain-containing protein [Acinetobacter marinus]SDB91313.1 FHA domain-containing protein [Acinetobacter marinus]